MSIQNKIIAVIIPAYRASKTIEAVIRSVPDFVDRIVVVDDASDDATSQAAKRSGDSRLILAAHPVNQGVGGAVLTGYAEAERLGCDIFVKMDADGQMKPQYLPSLLDPLLQGKADYAKGNRFADPARLQSMPFPRRLGNTLHSWMTRFATGHWHIFDSTNGYTALTAAAYRRLSPNHLARGYFFETSMLMELKHIGGRVVDVGMPAVYEGETSHINGFQITLKFPVLLFKSWLRQLFRPRTRHKK